MCILLWKLSSKLNKSCLVSLWLGWTHECVSCSTNEARVWAGGLQSCCFGGSWIVLSRRALWDSEGSVKQMTTRRCVRARSATSFSVPCSFSLSQLPRSMRSLVPGRGAKWTVRSVNVQHVTDVLSCCHFWPTCIKSPPNLICFSLSAANPSGPSRRPELGSESRFL